MAAKLLTQRILDAMLQAADDVKELRRARGDINALATTNKTSLVAAINELHDQLVIGGAIIDDGDLSSNSKALSAQKIVALIQAAVSSVVGDAGPAYDTLRELQDLIVNDQTTAAALAQAVNSRVRFDDTQSLTQDQKLQACVNIGIGDPDTDFLAAYTNRKNS